MMTRMRQMTKGMFVLVGVAFIGLIVFEWGADIRGGGPDTTIGEVNGVKLSYNDFNKYYQQLYQNASAQSDGKIDESRLSFIKNQVWDEFIQRTLYQEQIDKLNIAVSDSEVVYHVYNFPIPELQQNPSLQTNGAFDINKYKAALPTMSVEQQISLENYYRASIPFQKLQNLITSSVRVSESEIIDDFKSKNLKAKVEFLAIRPSRFMDRMEVSDDEISSYYDDNIDEFIQEEKRELEYVSFPVQPTANDTNRLFTNINEIKERLALGEEFATLALEYSSDPTVNSNSGDLGYFDQTTMVKPFSDAAFAASPGDLVGPVQTIHGYHLIKVEDKKVENGVPKVKASHILMKITVGSSTRFDQEEEAREFSANAKDNGWNEAAQQSNFEIKSTSLFSEASGIVPGFGTNPAIANFAFGSSQDEISGVYSVDEGFVVLMLKTIQPKGPKPLTDKSVNRIIVNKIKLQKAKEMAFNYASNLTEKVSQNIPLKEISEADSNKYVLHNTSNSFSLNQSIPGVGKDAKFSATSFTLEIGQTSGLIESESGFYFQKLLEKTEFDSTTYLISKEGIKSALLSQKRRKVFQDWYDKLKENASITDKRREFSIY